MLSLTINLIIQTLLLVLGWICLNTKNSLLSEFCSSGDWKAFSRVELQASLESCILPPFLPLSKKQDISPEPVLINWILWDCTDCTDHVNCPKEKDSVGCINAAFQFPRHFFDLPLEWAAKKDWLLLGLLQLCTVCMLSLHPNKFVN